MDDGSHAGGGGRAPPPSAGVGPALLTWVRGEVGARRAAFVAVPDPASATPAEIARALAALRDALVAAGLMRDT